MPHPVVKMSLAFALVIASAGLLVGQQSGSGSAYREADTTSPEYGVAIVRDVMVSMRDGVKLATDLYLPAQDGKALPGPWPTVLERTPYSKHRFYANAPDGNDYARHGYVMVVQDVRGKYSSEGVFSSYPQEGPDGLDTFTWITKQPWSDGRIIATGSSYFASTAQAILVQNPPGLVAAAIRVGPGNYHEDGAWRGGAFLLSHNINYVLRLAAEGHEAAADPAVEEGASDQPADRAFAPTHAFVAPGARVFASCARTKLRPMVPGLAEPRALRRLLEDDRQRGDAAPFECGRRSHLAYR